MNCGYEIYITFACLLVKLRTISREVKRIAVQQKQTVYKDEFDNEVPILGEFLHV